jgi:hypothetical protein
MCAILLISSLSLLMASDEQKLTSTSQKEDIQGEIQKTQKVSEMRTVTVRGTLKMRPSRDVKAVKAVARDADATKATGQSKVQPKQGERIFQQPLQKRTNTLNHKNVKESSATRD